MKHDPLSPQIVPSTAPSHAGFQQITPSAADQIDAPPPYTPSPSHGNGATPPATPDGIPSPSSSTSPIPRGDVPLLDGDWRASPRRSHRPASWGSDRSRGGRDPYKPQARMSTDADAGAGDEGPWSKHDGVPGCCFSETAGCCFSARGGCCFSDTEGCCFSSTKGCCFSTNAGCCFSDHGGCCFGNRDGHCCSSGTGRR